MRRQSSSHAGFAGPSFHSARMVNGCRFRFAMAHPVGLVSSMIRCTKSDIKTFGLNGTRIDTRADARYEDSYQMRDYSVGGPEIRADGAEPSAPWLPLG